MSKSTIYPVNSVHNLAELAGIMCCNIGPFPTTYLGLPLGAKFKANEIWLGIIERRVTLINSVMHSIPTYHMSPFPIPAEWGVTLTSNFGKTYDWEIQLWVRNFQLCTTLQLNQILS
ncbi:unnamed protein product [Withania somnifera]